MKYSLFSLLLVMLLSCGREAKLTFDSISYSNTECADCPTVEIDLPQVLEKRKIGETINTALSEEVISLLTFEEETSISDIDGAISSFNTGYKDVRAKYPDESIPWEVSINGEIAFENAELLSVSLNSYFFTGGAHGYGSTRYLNFSKKKALELDRSQLFKNEQKFRDFAEIQFRLENNIPAEAGINSTGFMFERDVFYLPENIGFTDQGLILLYNPYEVASYADGSIEITLPYDLVNEFLVVRTGS